jgi:hypothetical protein
MTADIWDIRLLNPLSGPGLSDVEQRRIERHQA